MKVLLLDTAFAAGPIYDYLAEAGREVWVMGNRQHDLLARRAAGKWIEQDYSDVEAVRAHMKRLGISHIVPGCTDVSINTCVSLEISPHLDPPDTNRILANKRAFREICEDLALPAPRTFERARFPMPGKFICKPVDAFSGRGITVFDGAGKDALDAAYETAKKASPTATALIENYVAGQLYSCSAFIENQRIAERFYVLEASSANPFAVDTSYVAYDLPSAHTSLLEQSLEKLCATLELKDGLLHTQFILAEEGPFIVEVSRRCPGDLYPLLIEYSTGFRYAAKYASYFVEASLQSQSTTMKHVIRHTVGALKDSVFGGLAFNVPVKTHAFFPLHGMGHELSARQGMRAGVLFCEAASTTELLDACELFLSRRAYHLA